MEKEKKWEEEKGKNRNSKRDRRKLNFVQISLSLSRYWKLYLQGYGFASVLLTSINVSDVEADSFSFLLVLLK